MSPQEQQALLSIALLAAFADQTKADGEREAIRRMADNLGAEGAASLPALVQNVLLRRVTLSDAVAGLSDPAQRQLAYEMAVCVCDADGRQSPEESAFLADLRQRLGLSAEAAAQAAQAPDALVDSAERAPVSEVLPASIVAALPAVLPPDEAADGRNTAHPAASEAIPPMTSGGALDGAAEAALDASILRYAMINGALELLPQSWASMAIIPLQVKMVYGIGKAHGVEMDQGHIKEFIATVGVGLTSQYLEQFGRKLIGGLLGKVAGRAVGGLGRVATGAAFSFATTYALGQVAKRYYAGGRVMSTALLQQSFSEVLGPAKQLQQRYLPQIEQTARGLDAGKVMALVRGG